MCHSALCTNLLFKYAQFSSDQLCVTVFGNTRTERSAIFKVFRVWLKQTKWFRTKPLTNFGNSYQQFICLLENVDFRMVS